ncbi:MAG: ABC-2 family transporter protein [Chloroflexi bacterium]|nr:ABC-2 family transporter protein [Chloroflexota bacterium]
MAELRFSGLEARPWFGAHLALIRGSWRSQKAYPVSFVMLTGAMLFGTSLDFVTIAIIFTRLPRLGGFSLYEVALLYGISGVSFAITDLALGAVDLLPDYIRLGTLDTLLLRPLGILYQIATSELALRRAGKLGQSVAVLLLALVGLHIAWTPAKLGMLLLTLVTGPLLFGSIWVACTAHVFWTIDTGEVANAFYYGGNLFAQYPVDLFGRWLRDLMTFVLPLAFVSYEPALYILDKADPFGLPGFVPLLTPAVALAAVAVAAVVWHAGLRRYQGTGS